jgi:hypothetical protein
MLRAQLGAQASIEERLLFWCVADFCRKVRSPFVFFCFDLCKKLLPGTPAWASVPLTLVRSESDLLIVQQFAEQCAEISNFDMMVLIIRPPQFFSQSGCLLSQTARWLYRKPLKCRLMNTPQGVFL